MVHGVSSVRQAGVRCAPGACMYVFACWCVRTSVCGCVFQHVCIGTAAWCLRYGPAPCTAAPAIGVAFVVGQPIREGAE